MFAASCITFVPIYCVQLAPRLAWGFRLGGFDGSICQVRRTSRHSARSGINASSPTAVLYPFIPANRRHPLVTTFPRGNQLPRTKTPPRKPLPLRPGDKNFTGMPQEWPGCISAPAIIILALPRWMGEMSERVERVAMHLSSREFALTPSTACRIGAKKRCRTGR